VAYRAILHIHPAASWACPKGVRTLGPAASVDRRQAAGFFASGPGIHCWERRRAGGRRIRTSGSGDERGYGFGLFLSRYGPSFRRANAPSRLAVL